MINGINYRLKNGEAFSDVFEKAQDTDGNLKPRVAEKKFHEKILVADDNTLVRKLVSIVLKRLGYPVHTVSSGEQAVSHVKSIRRIC